MIKVLGGLLLGIGILVAGASGLCSLVVLAGTSTNSNLGEDLSMVLLFGGIPFVIGLLFIFGGRALLRVGRVDPPQ